jgi:hypothetical protein
MLLARRRPTTNLASSARSRPLRRANRSEEHRRAAARRAAPFDRAPLLRFGPLQRSPARDALSGAAALRTIPLRRWFLATRLARPRTFEQRRRPCGFTPCEYDAVRLDERTCRLRFRTPGRAAFPRGGLTCARNSTPSVDRFCEDRSAYPIPVTLRNDPSHQAPPLRWFAESDQSCIAA